MGRVKDWYIGILENLEELTGVDFWILQSWMDDGELHNVIDVYDALADNGIELTYAQIIQAQQEAFETAKQGV